MSCVNQKTPSMMQMRKFNTEMIVNGIININNLQKNNAIDAPGSEENNYYEFL